MKHLSVLDPTPMSEGQSAADALSETRSLAGLTDALGYCSYWVQEHHNTVSFAGTAPEILIADLAARTDRIKLGSGGVMLPNYSPLKVAEQFLTLSALHPGRIELGIGRATGADPRTSAALLGPGAQAFPTMFQLLKDWLLDGAEQVQLPADHRASGVYARPHARLPDLWLLASSTESAAYAGAVGVKLAFAEFLSPTGAGDAIAAYQAAFSPSSFCAEPYAAIGTVVLAAESEDVARQESRVTLAWNIARASGRFTPFPTPDEADRLIADTDMSTVAALRQRSLSGSADHVADALHQHLTRIRADEAFVLTISATPEARLTSYRLLMEAWQDLAD
ncbi:MAG: MsnO8 family LLM class oxidoreductase [Pseudomonadota bacterium]